MNRLEETSNEVRASLGHRQFDPGLRRQCLQYTHPHRRRPSATQVDAAPEPGELPLFRAARHLYVVGLWYPVARVGEPLRQVTVVRQQDQSGRVQIQPAHRIEAGQRPLQQVPSGRASLGIPERADYPTWLVEENVTRRFEANSPAVHFDPIRISPDPAPRLTNHDTVQPHTP